MRTKNIFIKAFLIFIVLYLLICISIYLIGFAIEQYYKEKIWIHRVNSIEKLQEINPKFDKIELDVVFLKNEKKFDVNHPPAESINLSLFEYLSSIKIKQNNMFWLDFKNLSKKNINQSIGKLDSICKVLNINEHQFIIESTNPFLLEKLKQKSYKTSYYLADSLNQLSKDELQEQLSIIDEMNVNYKTDYLSFSYRDYQIINNYYPNNVYLTWSFKFSEMQIINPIYILPMLKLVYYKYSILSDKKVEIVLFKYVTKEGNI